jgi:hypothetical protein
MTKAQFGTLRTLKSGSIQARYTGAEASSAPTGHTSPRGTHGRHSLLSSGLSFGRTGQPRSVDR